MLIQRIRNYLEARRLNKTALEVRKIKDNLVEVFAENPQLYDLLIDNLPSIYSPSDIASEMCHHQVAQEIYTYQVAQDLCIYSIASEISLDDVAYNIDLDDLAQNIEVYSADVADHLDIEDIASHLDIDSVVENSVENIIQNNFDIEEIVEGFVNTESLEENLVMTMEEQIAQFRDEIMNDVMNEIADRLSGIGEE